MIVRQFFDVETFTYTYFLVDEITRETVVIDPVYEQAQRDLNMLNELDLQLKYILETHVHADHITGSALLKQRFSEARAVVSKYAGVSCADLEIEQGDVLSVGSVNIDVLTTPGHTDGCVSYYVPGMVFTGDALLIRGCGRTDFQQGDPGLLYDSIQKIFSLSDDTLIYPGHNYHGLTVSTVREEKLFNPRLANKTRLEFIEIMNQLNLSPPQNINEAVPANLNCGKI